jgi:hypothetical protein
MPKKPIVKQSEKARTYLSDAFMNDKNLLKRLQSLITAAAMEVQECKGDPQRAALAIRDTLSVLGWQTIEYNMERQQADLLAGLREQVRRTKTNLVEIPAKH